MWELPAELIFRPLSIGQVVDGGSGDVFFFFFLAWSLEYTSSYFT